MCIDDKVVKGWAKRQILSHWIGSHMKHVMLMTGRWKTRRDAPRNAIVLLDRWYRSYQLAVSRIQLDYLAEAVKLDGGGCDGEWRCYDG